MVITLTAIAFHPSHYMIIFAVLNLSTHGFLSSKVTPIVENAIENLFYKKVNSLIRKIELKARLMRAKSDHQREVIKQFINYKYSLRLNGKELSYV